MKRFQSLLAVLLLFAMLLPNQAQAAEIENHKEIIHLDNGRYITVEITVIESRATSTKSGSKAYVCRDSDGVEEWRITLSGTFTYTGSSATCTASSCSVKITDSDWYVVSKSAGKSGSSATAAVTMGRKFLGITIEKESIDIKLTCDKNGNLS